MTLHKEGKASIILAITLAIVLVTITKMFLIEELAAIAYGIIAALVLLVVNFFRKPNTAVNANEELVLSPCDGKVVVVEEVEETEFFKDKRIQVSIFMSPLNVHINWFPISGSVTYQRYHPGLYLVAWHPKSSTENERTTVVIERKDKFAILVRQVAGKVARRIVCYAKENSQCEQGSELGFIKFGSRLDVYFPVGTDINVKIGDVVKGKQSVLAKSAL